MPRIITNEEITQALTTQSPSAEQTPQREDYRANYDSPPAALLEAQPVDYRVAEDMPAFDLDGAETNDTGRESQEDSIFPMMYTALGVTETAVTFINSRVEINGINPRHYFQSRPTQAFFQPRPVRSPTLLAMQLRSQPQDRPPVERSEESVKAHCQRFQQRTTLNSRYG